jgi:predicted alternative tryptophan synthase beta-subunit
MRSSPCCGAGCSVSQSAVPQPLESRPAPGRGQLGRSPLPQHRFDVDNGRSVDRLELADSHAQTIDIQDPHLIGQEVSGEPEIEIPEAVRDVYKLWRPTPLFRARRLERALGTPAHIYYKYEGGSPAGSHKPNTAVAQAYANAEAGVRKLSTETGAGQWGSALARAGRR